MKRDFTAEEAAIRYNLKLVNHRSPFNSSYSDRAKKCLDTLFRERYNSLPDVLKGVLGHALNHASVGDYCFQPHPLIPIAELKSLELLGYEVDTRGVVHWSKQTWWQRLFKLEGSVSPPWFYQTTQYSGLAWQLHLIAYAARLERTRGRYTEEGLRTRLALLEQVLSSSATFSGNACGWKSYMPKLRELGFNVGFDGPAWNLKVVISIPPKLC